MYEQVHTYKNLFQTFKIIKKNSWSKRKFRKFEKNLTKNLKCIQEELEQKTYRLKPYKLRIMLKKNKERKILVCSLRDRIVQQALKQVLGKIYQEKFLDCSYAFQKGKSTLQAIQQFEKSKKKYVLKADIKDFFDSIDHGMLLDIIRRDVKDKDLFNLIEKFVKIKYIGKGKVFDLKKGIPLGNVLSGLLSNIYLNDLDKHMNDTIYIRYPDDMIVVGDTKEELLVTKQKIETFLSKRKLRLNKKKTKIIRITEGVNFLDYEVFKRMKRVKRENAKKFRNKVNFL